MPDLRRNRLDIFTRLASEASLRNMLDYRNLIPKISEYFNSKVKPVKDRVLGIKTNEPKIKIKE